jgi:outer membrane protein assembly factor BamB
LVDRESRHHRYFVVMRYQQALWFPALCAVLCSACRKEVENEAPHISITAPAEGSSLSVPDTLMVTLTARDDIGLEQVAVSLLDQNQIPAGPAASRSVSGTSTTVTLALPITSAQLASGDYSLYATAYDGHLTGNDFLNLHVSAVPLQLRAIYTVTESAGQTQLYKTDSTGQTLPAATWAMDFGGAAVSSAAQLLFVAGGAEGNFLALGPNSLGTLWQLPNLGNIGAPWFTSVDLGPDGRVYVGQDNGTLRGFLAANGTGTCTATLPDQFRAVRSLVVGDLLICTERHFVTHQEQLGLYYRSTGALQAIQALDMDAVQVFNRDAQHLLIFGNRNGHGVVQDRSVAGGSGWEPAQWPAEITAVEQVAPGTWLVALANGSLQRYNFNNSTSFNMATTPVLNTMVLDPVSGLLYAGADGQVLVLDPTTGANAGSWAVAGAVRRILPLYNR